MGVHPASIKRYLKRALETESMFPSSLSPEEVGALRQLQAEVLANSRQKAIETHAVVAARMGTSQEKNMDATASARLLEAVTRAVDLESALFGTRQPLKIVEQSLRTNLTLIDSRVEVHLDRDQLRPKWATPYGPREPGVARPKELLQRFKGFSYLAIHSERLSASPTRPLPLTPNKTASSTDAPASVPCRTASTPETCRPRAFRKTAEASALS